MTTDGDEGVRKIAMTGYETLHISVSQPSILTIRTDPAVDLRVTEELHTVDGLRSRVNDLENLVAEQRHTIDRLSTSEREW